MALRDIRPYMLQAHIQWLDDSNESPHIVVLNGPGVVFPEHLREEASLLFNVSSQAVDKMEINDEGMAFLGRFGGRVARVSFPLDAIVSVQNRGASFIVSFATQEEMVQGQGPNEPEQSTENSTGQVPGETSKEESTRPQLTVVGGNTAGKDTKPTATKRGLHLVKGPNE